MKRMFTVLTAAACTLSLTGSAAAFAKDSKSDDSRNTEEKTLKIVYAYPEEGGAANLEEAGTLTYAAEQETAENTSYVPVQDIQTFVMENAPDKGYEVSLAKVWFDSNLKKGTKLTDKDTQLEVKDADTLYLEAQKDDGQYDIVFYSAPGQVLKAETVKAGDPIELPDRDPEQEGKVFAGWGLEKDARAESDLYLYPQWKEAEQGSADPAGSLAAAADADQAPVNSVSLTFDPGNGQDPQILTVEKGTEVTDADVYTPTRKGYAFKGWSPALPGAADSSETFQAQWVRTYEVKWVADGQNVQSDTVEEGQPTPEAPDVSSLVPEGEVFKGWDPAPASTVSQDVTYTAQFEKEAPSEPEVAQVTIRFAGGDTDLAPVTVTKGTKTDGVSLPVPEKTGYTFTGWSGLPENGVFDADTTLTAEFTRTEYTITYRLGDVVLAEKKAYYGDPTPVIEDPAREGFTFEGWKPEVAATVTGNAEYEAQWKMVPAKDLKITIQYLEEGTNRQLHYSNVVEVREGSAYDVSRFDKPDIAGYTYVKTEGSLVGTADKDATVTVWYVSDKKAASSTKGTDTSTDTSAALYVGIGAAALVGVVALVLLKKKK